MRGRRTTWRSIGAVLMFNSEALFGARQGAANVPAKPATRTTMTSDELLAILCDDDPPPAA